MQSSRLFTSYGSFTCERARKKVQSSLLSTIFFELTKYPRKSYDFFSPVLSINVLIMNIDSTCWNKSSETKKKQKLLYVVFWLCWCSLFIYFYILILLMRHVYSQINITIKQNNDIFIAVMWLICCLEFLKLFFWTCCFRNLEYIKSNCFAQWTTFANGHNITDLYITKTDIVNLI